MLNKKLQDVFDETLLSCCFRLQTETISVVAADWLAVKPRSSSKEHHLQMTLYSWYFC